MPSPVSTTLTSTSMPARLITPRQAERCLKTLGNQPGVYFWRLTNGRVPKMFHACPHNTKWWLPATHSNRVREENESGAHS
jgi:hypothetical protein